MEKPVVLIMAGGKGERFWPRSRETRPKQLQRVYSSLTLLEETWNRALSITHEARIFVGCNDILRSSILETHTFIPSDNFIVEPEPKNTAPIVALAALQLEARFPGSVQVILSADHFITPLSEFQKTMERAIETAMDGYLVTLGIQPTRPETGYGYIHADQPLQPDKREEGWSIHGFQEKPDLATATTYIQRGDYLWNSGIFIWKGSVIIDEFHLHGAETMDPIERASGNMEQMKEVFSAIKSDPIDVVIMEKSKKVAMVPATFRWDDVGSWHSLERILPGDEQGNTYLSEGTEEGSLIALNSRGNVVISTRPLVAMLGVEDIVLVEEEDLLFLASRKSIGDIKNLLAELRKKPSLQKYLK